MRQKMPERQGSDTVFYSRVSWSEKRGQAFVSDSDLVSESAKTRAGQHRGYAILYTGKKDF